MTIPEQLAPTDSLNLNLSQDALKAEVAYDAITGLFTWVKRVKRRR